MAAKEEIGPSNICKTLMYFIKNNRSFFLYVNIIGFYEVSPRLKIATTVFIMYEKVQNKRISRINMSLQSQAAQERGVCFFLSMCQCHIDKKTNTAFLGCLYSNLLLYTMYLLLISGLHVKKTSKQRYLIILACLLTLNHIPWPFRFPYNPAIPNYRC